MIGTKAGMDQRSQWTLVLHLHKMRVLVGVVGMHDARDPTVVERSHLEGE